MCGIVGYTGARRAAPFLIKGLEKLEYRGYDSAGVATVCGGKFCVLKRRGRVSGLGDGEGIEGCAGIGHTRWATHGAPSERNAHPHVYGRFAVVHNGIIENERVLKEECLARGEVFSSDTDSEVIAHLLERAYAGDPLSCVAAVCKRLEGSYALAIMCSERPDAIVCVRKKSSLVVGKNGSGEVFVASDLPAIAMENAEYFVLKEGWFALLERGKISLFDGALQPVFPDPYPYEPQKEELIKNGYKHFMRKEIDEIPLSMRDSVPDLSSNTDYNALCKVLCQAQYIEIIACGTAYHSGLCAAHAFERICRVPCRVSLASEFRYRDPIVKEGSLVIAVSQSGETADTLAAAQLAKERGAYLLAITNVPCSSLTAFADCVLYTRAGREIAVAATKSFNAQLAVFYELVRLRASRLGKVVTTDDLPVKTKLSLQAGERVKSWAPNFLSAKSVFFLGRGADYCVAAEASLKLKEITYLPSEGYCAGELKHGTLALVDHTTPVVAVLTQRALAEKTMNAVHEVCSRGAKVFLVTAFPEYAERKEVFSSVIVPACEEAFSPAVAVIPLQLLAYYVALALGNDPDKPRNLAKSVTVE